LRDPFLQEQPAALAISAVVDRIDKLVVIIVVSAPLDGDGVTVAHRSRHRYRTFHVRLFWSLWNAIPRLDCYLIDFRRHILWKIVDDDAVRTRRRIARMQHSPPLNETRRWYRQPYLILIVDGQPRAPIAVRVVHVSAACKQVNCA